MWARNEQKKQVMLSQLSFCMLFTSLIANKNPKNA